MMGAVRETIHRGRHMRRPFFLFAGGFLAILMLTLVGCGGSPASPFAGTWKVTALPAGKEISMWLVRIESKDDGLHASVLPGGLSQFEGATVEEVRADGDALHLTLSAQDRPYAFVFHRPEGEAEPKQLLGSTAIRGARDFARLERTDQKKLDKNEALVVHDSQDDLERALRVDPGPASEAALRKVIDRYPDESSAYVARLGLVEALAERGAEDDARAEAGRAVAHAARYGPEMRRQALRDVALAALLSGKLPAMALDFARQAEALAQPSVPADERLPILKVLARALRAAGQDDEAREVAGRVAGVEEELDRAFEAKALPFDPPPFPGRKGKSERVALVELFTSASCQPCVAADMAFDALLRTFTPRDVVLVQYHLSIPAADPLTIPDGERRAGYYDVGATPSWYVNGRAARVRGGGRDEAEDVYKRLLGGLAEQLEAEPAASLKVAAERKGERIDVTAEAGGLKTRGAVRLRLLLVEDVVRYPGPNGRRLHRHVVRAFPGGVEGVAVSAPGGRHQATIDIAELRKTLREQLADFRALKDEEGPVELKRLKVVAFLQDDSKAVLQAAQADVPDQ
jgi:hypothetical protein